MASCSGRWVRLCFVLCNVGSIIMTVAINALYLPFVDFYAPALLASRSTMWVRLGFVLHNADHCLTCAVIIALFLLAVPLASCFVRWVRLCFVLCNVGSIPITPLHRKLLPGDVLLRASTWRWQPACGDGPVQRLPRSNSLEHIRPSSPRGRLIALVLTLVPFKTNICRY